MKLLKNMHHMLIGLTLPNDRYGSLMCELNKTIKNGYVLDCRNITLKGGVKGRFIESISFSNKDDAMHFKLVWGGE